MNHGLDTDERVCFYEQEFYPLSNFSAFALRWAGERYDTSEAAYHSEKFNWSTRDNDRRPSGLIPTFQSDSDADEFHRNLWAIRRAIREATSAHEAFKLAEVNREFRRPDWDAVKVDIMREILRAKVGQHEYVRRKLLETGDRELVENSWRDGFWGWGEDRKGQNMLGKLWMEIRAELRTTEAGHGI